MAAQLEKEKGERVKKQVCQYSEGFVGQWMSVQPLQICYYGAARLTDRRCCLQVEFYFSDSNAPRDKFLLQQIQADPEVRDTVQPQRLSGRRSILLPSPRTKLCVRFHYLSVARRGSLTSQSSASSRACKQFYSLVNSSIATAPLERIWPSR